MTPYGKIFKILFHKDSSPHRLIGCVQISWNLADGKSVKSCIAYLTKKQNFAWLSSSRHCADRAQNLPEPVPEYVLRVLMISPQSVNFRRSYTRTCEYHQNGILWKVSSGWHENYINYSNTAKITYYLSTFWLHVGSLHQDWLPVPVVSM